MSNKIFKRLFYFVIIAIFAGILICGTLIYMQNKTTYLESPNLTIDEENNLLIWNDVENAAYYDVYANDSLKATIEDDETKTKYTYDYTSIVKNLKSVRFKICVRPEENQSKFTQNYSPVVVYVNSETSISEKVDFANNENIVNRNIKVSANNILTWDEISGIAKYVVTISTNNGTKVVNCDTNALKLDSFALNDITCFRVGYRNADNELVLSEEYFYNYADKSGDKGEYTKTIINFNNRYDDLYISSEEEFINVLYYMLVYKKSNLTLKFTNSYMQTLVGSASGETKKNLFKEKFEELIYYELNETCAFEPSFKFVDANQNVVTINFDFYGVGESYLTSPNYVWTNNYTTKSEYFNGATKKVFVQNTDYEPYYLTHTYAKRSSDYDDFASDKRIKLEEVSTTEQLHWAVSHNSTPICVPGSSAERMYNKIKGVLREIISDEMTDYEKVLSIYDYIAYNTVYDYNILYKSSEQGSSFNATVYNCFYLEGVFDDNLAVCDGFSKAFDIMCEMEGIECARISGSTSGGGHAWNKVKLDGNWYGVDITWTEIELDVKNENQITNEQILTHEYFLVSDNVLRENVSIDHNPYDVDYDLTMPANSNYSYYSNLTYNYNNATYDFVVGTQEQLNNLFKYLKESGINNVEFIIINKSSSEIDSMLRIAKSTAGITTVLEFISSEPKHSGFDTFGNATIVAVRNTGEYA